MADLDMDVDRDELVKAAKKRTRVARPLRR